MEQGKIEKKQDTLWVLVEKKRERRDSNPRPPT